MKNKLREEKADWKRQICREVKAKPILHITNLSFKGFIILVDFWHGVQCRVISQKPSIQEAAHWSEIGGSGTAGASGSPYKLL